MDFNELVRRRYSCRAYKTDAVEDDKVRSILEAGRLAPTARNDQPVRVIAVRSKEGLAKLEEAGHIYDARSRSSSAPTRTRPGPAATTG